MQDQVKLIKKIKSAVLKEDIEQNHLVEWLDKNNIDFYAIPNGGKRDSFVGFKLKLQGVKKGVPDICIPIASKAYHGLYIELKRKVGGRTTQYQKDWIEKLKKNGYYATIANGFEEAKKIILDYLGKSDTCINQIIFKKVTNY